MAIQGVFASNQQIIGNRMGDFASTILKVFPTGTAPLLGLTSGMPNEEAKDTIVNWFEETKLIQRTGMAAAANATTTTLMVNDGSSFVEGVILVVEETDEHLLVTNSAGRNPTTLTVVRGFASTTAAAINMDHNLTRIGSAYEEGSDIPTAVVNQGKHRTNYTQIFRTAWSITGTTKAVEFRTGSQLQKNKADAMFFHAEDMERAIWFGKKFVSQKNGKPFHGMDGVVTQIENYGGTVRTLPSNQISMRTFRDFIREIFRFNIKGAPNERMAFCGDITLQVLNEAANRDSEYQITGVETDFGLKFTRWHTPFGTLMLMTHPLFVENPYWQSRLYALHPGGIVRRTLRPTTSEGYDTNGNRIQGRDRDDGVMTTEMSIECRVPETMGILNNVMTDVASNP